MLTRKTSAFCEVVVQLDGHRTNSQQIEARYNVNNIDYERSLTTQKHLTGSMCAGSCDWQSKLALG